MGLSCSSLGFTIISVCSVPLTTGGVNSLAGSTGSYSGVHGPSSVCAAKSLARGRLTKSSYCGIWAWSYTTRIRGRLVYVCITISGDASSWVLFFFSV